MPFGSQFYLFKRHNYDERRNIADEQLTALWSAISLLSGGPGGGFTITGEVLDFGSLPVAASFTGKYYVVRTTTGIIGFRKFAGLYRSDGAAWIYVGNPVAAASDILNVAAGSISANNVQGAVDELDGDLQGHIGSRGASHATSTTTEAGFLSALDHLKLSGIQAAATANSPDATLLARANHTGFQPTSTITSFNAEVDARASTLITAHTAAADPHPGYLTAAEGNAAYSLLGHSHVIADVTGLQPALDGKLGTGAEAASVNTINGRIAAGTNVTITGTGSAVSPYVINSAGVGGGTVTSVSVVTANGVSGSVATPTTTPAITLTLGAVTPTSVAASGTITGSNLSGTNTGDQTITLTGDVTGSGTGSFASTIAAGVVSNAKLATVATATFKARSTAGIGAPEDLTVAQAKALLAIVSADLSDFNSASRAQTEAELLAGTNITITPGGTGATRTLTLASIGGGGTSIGLDLALNNAMASA